MRILFLIRCLEYGGAERQLVTLVCGLQQRAHEVAVVVFYPGGPLTAELQRQGIPVLSLDKRGRWDVFGFLYRLLILVRLQRPDILHAYLGVPNILAVLLKPFCRPLRIGWGVRAADLDLSRYDWLARLVFRLECRLARHADFIVANSRAGHDHVIAQGFPAQRMKLIPNGIDTERFCPDSAARQVVRSQWGIAEQQIVIGLVARLDPVKNHRLFLAAAAELAQERSDVCFVCIGDGPEAYRQELQAYGKELGLSQALLWTQGGTDMPALYNALDIACSTSHSEGFANAIGEAMACACVCVVTDVGDSAWIVGDSGRVVPAVARAQLLQCWRELCVLSVAERCSLGLAARKRIIADFSVAQLLDRTEKVFWDTV